MSAAFTDQEKTAIINHLRKAAWNHACNEGMRKTSVEMLAEEAGISKGAFYHFYPSKELLFLDMLEVWQKNAYAAAEKVLEEQADLPAPVRASAAFRAAFRYIVAQPIGKFLAEEVPIMLRRIPENELEKHYQSQEEFIISMIHQVGVVLTVPDHTAAAAIMILMLSLVNADRIGDHYHEGIDALVDCACKQLIADK